MIETGNYIVPFFNCHIRFDKPILYYLELVIPFKLFFVDSFIKNGHDPVCIIEYAARLPSIIAGSFTVLLTYLTSLKLLQSKTYAKNASIALLSFLFFAYLTRAVYPDASLIAFELAAIYFFMSKKHILAWIFVALAFLTKGPIGILIPGFTYCLYLWIIEKKSGLGEFFSIRNIIGFGAFILVATPWYAAMYHYYGFEFINKFLIYHNIERFTGKAHQHPSPFYYYIPVIIAVSYMWIAYLRQLYLKIDFKDKKNIFLIAWFGWIVLFFSISSNKLAHYIAPAFIPLSIILGRYVSQLENTRKIQITLFLFEVALGVGLSIYAYSENLIYLIPTALFGLFFTSLLNFDKDLSSVIFRKVIALNLIMAVLLMQFEMYRPEKRIWRSLHKNSFELYQYKIKNNGLIAYTRKCLNPIKSLSSIEKAEKPFYIYTRIKYINDIKFNKHIFFYAKDKGKDVVFMIVK
jgi:4-amino-4-deoxy-L-arabinose transferase-like glycosyltransferase